MRAVPSTIIEEPSESSVTAADCDPRSVARPITSDHYLLSIIADEDTCVGYILGGIGEINEAETPNYFVVHSYTTDKEIENAYLKFISRKDMGLVLITKEVAERIYLPHKKSKHLPVVIKIPNKNGPYVIEIDDLLDIAQSHDRAKEEKIRNIQEQRRVSLQERIGLHARNNSSSKVNSDVCEIHRVT